MSYDTIAERMRLYGYKPSDSELLVSDEDGWTIAHQLAASNTLPYDFSHWSLVDATGTSVLHVAASHGRLWKNFTRAQVEGIYNKPNAGGLTPWQAHLKHGEHRINEMREILKR